jgi:LysR family transcriptional regulator, regulator for bpeEF and oprC
MREGAVTRDLNETLMFVKVVEKGSFTAAALALGVPKTTVSRKVQELEERLGAKLLKRTTRKLGLTEPGQIYFEHCSRIARELDEAETAVSHLNGAPRGWLRFTAPYSIGVNSLARLLPEFMSRYPDIRIDMHLDNSVVDLVGNQIDVALRVGNLPDSGMQARLLARFHSHVYASPSYIAAHGEPLSPDELEHHRTLAYNKDRRNGRYAWQLAQEGEAHVEYPVNPVMVVNDPNSLRTATLQGLGLCRMADVMAAPFEAGGWLRRVLSVWSLPPVELNAVFQQGRAMSPKVRAFVDFLAERLTDDRHLAGVNDCSGMPRCPETRVAVASIAPAVEAAAAETTEAVEPVEPAMRAVKEVLARVSKGQPVRK